MIREGSLEASKVAIIGLGLMGGSLAMALRGRCERLLGCDCDQDTMALALERGVVDEVDADPAAILPRADVVILATPVRTILNILQRLPQVHPGSAMVMDLGSTKSEILQAMGALPAQFDPIGGHPMCGKETSGLEHADPGIYRGASFALTPLERSSPKVRAIAEEIVHTVGAQPVWLDGETHDAWVAVTSHLPYLLSVALVNATPPDTAPMVGPGYRGSSRLAGSDPQMMFDILVTNRANILHALERFLRKVKELGWMCDEGDEASLMAQLVEASRCRARLVGDRRDGDA
jgi:prephenate dehydrogenase